MTFFRVKPNRVRVWHATDRFEGPTLCNKSYAPLDAMIKQGAAIDLVKCERCRTVLQNRAARAE